MTDEVTIDRFSRLYCRYNGFMFGLFDAINQIPWREQDVAFRRLLMEAFLKDTGLDIPLPSSGKPWASGPPEATRRLVELQELLRPELVQCAGLPYVLLSYAEIRFAQGPAGSASVRGQAEQILRLLGGDASILDLFDEAITPIDASKELISDRVSACLRVLEALIKSVPVEGDTAFVIMPFAKPYADRYWTLYRPSLEGAGFRSFRAWGNLMREDYGPLLIELIRKSGAVFADLSRLGANELYEVGAAHALGKPAFLVAETSFNRHLIPSNLHYDAIFLYEPDEQINTSTTVAQLCVHIHAALRVLSDQPHQARYRRDAIDRVIRQAIDSMRSDDMIS
jgi:hypothetical protein